jgi:hypothetical protein
MVLVLAGNPTHIHMYAGNPTHIHMYAGNPTHIHMHACGAVPRPLPVGAYTSGAGHIVLRAHPFTYCFSRSCACHLKGGDPSVVGSQLCKDNK